MTAALVLFGGLCALVIKECARLDGDLAVEHPFETGRLLDDQLVTRDLHACAFGDSKSGDQTSESGHRGDVPPQVLKVAQRGRRRGRGAQDHDEYGHTECAPHLAGSVSGCERNERANSSASRFCYEMHFIFLRCVMQLTSIGVWNERVLPRWTVRWPSA